MQKKFIIFRPNAAIAEQFRKLIDALDVSQSELARRAIQKGLQQAAEEIAAERRKEAQRLLKKLGKLPPTSFMWIPEPHLKTA